MYKARPGRNLHKSIFDTKSEIQPSFSLWDNLVCTAGRTAHDLMTVAITNQRDQNWTSTEVIADGNDTHLWRKLYMRLL